MPLHQPVHPGPALVRFLDEESSALQGFPVRPLIQHWLNPKSRAHSRPDSSAGRLLQQVMQCWVAELARQLATMPEGGSLVLERVRQRTHASHDAIVRLLALVGPSLADTGTTGHKTARLVTAVDAAQAPSRSRQEGSPLRRDSPRRADQTLPA